MLDYLHHYKDSFRLTDDWKAVGNWDVFISAFNSSERVAEVFPRVQAAQKTWAMLLEYGYANSEAPKDGSVVFLTHREEDEAILELLAASNIRSGVRLCVDITGFMRPHILFLLVALKSLGVTRFDALYSEPARYAKKEETMFSDGNVSQVRQVSGYEGVHSTDISNDILIVTAGYDHALVSGVLNDKDHAKVGIVYGLPSLSADMYQESILRLSTVLGGAEDRQFRRLTGFAPANDPYVTAIAVSDLVSNASRLNPITNLYISPLSTKPQALGVGLYYLREQVGKAGSIVFPFCKSYSRETSKGVGRIWRYEVLLD